MVGLLPLSPIRDAMVEVWPGKRGKVFITDRTGREVLSYPERNTRDSSTEHQKFRMTSVATDAVARGIKADAALIAGSILNALDYVGVLGVEMFVLASNQLLVNEIAPRVHNSGHWTIEACIIDQFQQHVRAIAGWPLGDGRRHSDAVMTNLIGSDADAWREIAAQDCGLHLYGKAQARPGRKMGHVTRLVPRP